MHAFCRACMFFVDRVFLVTLNAARTISLSLIIDIIDYITSLTIIAWSLDWETSWQLTTVTGDFPSQPNWVRGWHVLGLITSHTLASLVPRLRPPFLIGLGIDNRAPIQIPTFLSPTRLGQQGVTCYHTTNTSVNKDGVMTHLPSYTIYYNFTYFRHI